jgi:tetratricopeptide (TPR) repeat protein
MRLALTILFLWTTLISHASPTDAESAYERGEYQTALEQYLALNEEQTSAGLLYNIGNCYFKMEQLPEAILYYERATLLSPADEDIRSNLSFAQQQVIDRIKPLPSLELGTYWDRFKAGSDINYWARISLFACLLAFISLAGLFYVGGAKRKVGIAITVLFFLTTVFSIAMAATRKNELLRGSEAIIMKSKVDIKSAPAQNSADLFLLHEGTKVIRLRNEDGWSEVRLANGKVGWMQTEELEVI